MKKTLIACLVAVVAIVSLYFIFRDIFDRFNPWMEQEYVYVEIQSEPTDDNGRFKYREQGITEDGETRRVIFTTSTRLDPGTFLRVLAKGSHTVEYRFIHEDEIP